MNIDLLKVLVNLSIFSVMIYFLRKLAKIHLKFHYRVGVGFILGLLLGLILQGMYGSQSPIISMTTQWIGLIGNGYISFLRMLVIPLIIVSILSAVLKMNDANSLGKKGILIISILIVTTVIAAGIGIFFSSIFKLTAPDIVSAATLERSTYLHQLTTKMGEPSITQQLKSLLPGNPFGDMAGLRNSSMFGVVLFFSLFAIAALQLARKKPDVFALVKSGSLAIHDVVLRMATIILRWTPYGVMALMTVMMAISPWQDIYKLSWFVIASYASLILMFIVHLAVILTLGLNPITYIQKAWPALVFGFVSRSSAVSIPINTRIQINQIGVDETSAGLSASLGSSIGQNGCGGIYPAMVAIMIYMSQGTEITWGLVGKLLFVIAISSFGVAGIGGGATFSAIIVLSILGLPVNLAGLLISIEPLIDMGRTALNVSGSIIAGIFTSRVHSEFNPKIFNNPVKFTIDRE